jgi:hypothetical protein
MVNDQIIKGYSFAYSQLLEAIQEKDETYLSHIAGNYIKNRKKSLEKIQFIFCREPPPLIIKSFIENRSFY